jgi:hypothetical protein
LFPFYITIDELSIVEMEIDLQGCDRHIAATWLATFLPSPIIFAQGVAQLTARYTDALSHTQRDKKEVPQVKSSEELILDAMGKDSEWTFDHIHCKNYLVPISFSASSRRKG